MADLNAIIDQTTELVLRLMILAVVIYAAVSIADVLVFNGALPVV